MKIDPGECPVCGGPTDRTRDASEGTTYESSETCPACRMYDYDFLYGRSVERFGWVEHEWSHNEQRPGDWLVERDEARKIHANPDGRALFAAGYPADGEWDVAAIGAFADWCAEHGCPAHEKFLRGEMERVGGELEQISCPGGCWPLGGVWVTSSDGRKYSAAPARKCVRCDGTGLMWVRKVSR